MSYESSKVLLDICRKHQYLNLAKLNGRNQIKLGPLGSLLAKNIAKEWWDSVMFKSKEEIFDVTNQVYNSSSLGSQYYSILQLKNRVLPFGLAEIGNYARDIHTRNNQCCNAEDIDDSSFDINDAKSAYLSLKYFSAPKLTFQSFHQLEKFRMMWWRSFLVDPSSISMKAVESDYEIQFKFPWGESTIELIKNHGTSPLEDYRKETNLILLGKSGPKMVIPSMIECKTNFEAAILVFLFDSLSARSHGKSELNVLKLNPCLVPYKVTIVISSKNSDVQSLRDLAKYVSNILIKEKMLVYPNPGLQSQTSLSSQFNRYDEMGIPFVVILSDNSLNNGILNLRNRNTTLKEEIHITELAGRLKQYLIMQ